MSNKVRELGEKRAVLVGINHYYLDDAIGNLKYCVNDVVELNGILSDSLRGKFTIQPLHSDMEDRKLTPTRSNIMSMIKLLSNNSEQNDTILFYFAGHDFEQDVNCPKCGARIKKWALKCPVCRTKLLSW